MRCMKTGHLSPSFISALMTCFTARFQPPACFILQTDCDRKCVRGLSTRVVCHQHEGGGNRQGSPVPIVHIVRNGDCLLRKRPDRQQGMQNSKAPDRRSFLNPSPPDFLPPAGLPSGSVRFRSEAETVNLLLNGRERPCLSVYFGYICTNSSKRQSETDFY